MLRGKGAIALFLLSALAVLAWWFAAGTGPGSKAGAGGSVSAPAADVVPILPPDDEVHAGYAGSASCKECHEEVYAKWKDSNHGMAEREYRPEMDGEAFAPRQTLRHTQDVSEMFLDEEGVAKFLTQGLAPQRQEFPVVRVIGHNPLRQFLVPAPGGRLQTMDVSWDPHRKEWFDVYGEEDRRPGEWGHWTGQGMNWNAMCASCHNTRLRKNYDPKTDSYATAQAERSVGCEACHGPMKDHVDWQRKAPSLGLPEKPDPTVKKFTRDQHLETCGACHARRIELSGDLVPGEPFHQHFQLTHTDETAIYYPDGQVFDENFEYASFLSSGMHGAGVRCVDCHDPHSGKRLIQGNMLCMRCHSGHTEPPAPIIDPATHSPCGEHTSGGQCTSCHMPLTTYMQRHPRHDHGFTIPDPWLTREYGVPNACNRCHTDRDTEWALEKAEGWYGDKLNRPTRHRAVLFARARRGEQAASQGLMALLREEKQPPIWKAGACRLLGQWVFQAEVRAALLAQLGHADPLVRAAVCFALTPAARPPDAIREVRDALEPLLDDESRSVRVAAAWALCDSVDLDSTAGRELQHMLRLASDQPTGQMQLAQLAHARGETDKALGHMRRAIEVDPYSPPFHHDLAILLNSRGDLAGAIASLREAVKLDPDQAEYHYKLALALHETGDLAAATASLETTVKQDPAYGRAWYNLGLAYHSSGRSEDAIRALLQAETHSPGDAMIPYARATILYRLGRRNETIEALQRALAIRPDFREALELRAELTRPPR